MNILQQVEKLVKLVIKEKVAMPLLAKVDKLDTKEYTCDCIELTNELEETKTIYTRVKIPRMWGAEKSGVWMSPSKGAIVLLNFLNGDRNYPIISAIMGSDQKEDAPEDTLIIKCGDNIIQLDDKILLQVKDTKLIIEESQISIETKDGAKVNLSDTITMESKQKSQLALSNKIEMKTQSGSEILVDTQIGIKSSAGNLKEIVSDISNFLPTINTLGSPAAQSLNPALIPKCVAISVKIPLVLK